MSVYDLTLLEKCTFFGYNQAMDIKNLYAVDGSLNRMLFSPQELRQVLSAYSEGVLRKGWKDYAIDANPQQSVFSVVDHQNEGGGSVALYSFSKNKPQSKGSDRFFYRIFHRDSQLLRTESFLEALAFFRELDGKPPSKKKKQSIHAI